MDAIHTISHFRHSSNGFIVKITAWHLSLVFGFMFGKEFGLSRVPVLPDRFLDSITGIKLTCASSLLNQYTQNNTQTEYYTLFLAHQAQAPIFKYHQ